MNPPRSSSLECVGAPFGVRGWVKLRSFTEPPDRLLEHRRLQLGLRGAWTTYRIEEQRPQRRTIDRQARRSERPGPGAGLARRPGRRAAQRAAAGRRQGVLRADLIGCDVVNLEGRRLGVVSHFVESPAQVLMVVRGEREYWVPAVPQHLRRVDLRIAAGGRGLGRRGRVRPLLGGWGVPV